MVGVAMYLVIHGHMIPKASPDGVVDTRVREVCCRQT